MDDDDSVEVDTIKLEDVQGKSRGELIAEIVERNKEGLGRLAREEPAKQRRSNRMVKQVFGERHTEEIRELLDDTIEENAGVPYNDKERLQCEDVQPRNSEFVGAGRNRCVFETENHVVKVARWKQGRQENEGAKDVLMHASSDSRDAFAMPVAVDESNSVVIQEKAEVGGVYQEVEDKLGEVYERDNLSCRDIGSGDIGRIEGKGSVLIDLGGCDPK